MNLNNTLAKHSKDIQEVTDWANAEYDKYFAPYFKREDELYKKMKSSENSIGDDELEWILSDLPLELFSVTEQLSNLKTAQEVIKLNIKKTEREYIQHCVEGSETKKKEAASALTEEDKLLVTVYDSIIERVSRQMTFSKELIMSAKKIWDARRNDGIPLPNVQTSDNTLPEYDFNKD